MGVVALLDFGGSGTSITLADAGVVFEPIDETLRYTEFSGDQIDQALLSHILDSLAATSIRPHRSRRIAQHGFGRNAGGPRSGCPSTRRPRSSSNCRVTAPTSGSPEMLGVLIEQPLDGVLTALAELTERNGLAPTGLAALGVVGGGASIPLVTQRLSEHTRLPVVTTPHPALDAAVGAALFAAFGADADAPTGAAAAATDATAAAAVFDRPGPDVPGSATFRALAWSQDEGGDEPVPYTGENPYQLPDSDIRPAVQYVPPTGPIFEEPRRPWHRMATLAIGVAAVIAIIAVGGVAYALTSATESTKATESSGVEPPKPPEPKEPPAPKDSPEPPPPPPPPEPPSEEAVTSEAPPPSPSFTPTTTVPPTTTGTTTTTSPTTTTTSPTTTTPTTTTTTTTTSTTPSMTTTYIRVPFVPVPVPIQVPNQGPVNQPPQYQPPQYQPFP